jgi:catalase (peroxidase I)
MMLTTDIALKADPVYEPIARRFRQHPEPLSKQDIAARKDRLLLPD